MARTCVDPKTDEELIEWIKSKETIKDLRIDNYAWYQQCIKRGLREHFPPKMTTKTKYSDKELIEWLSQFETRAQIREADFNKYVLCKRRKLVFPPKLTRCGNPVGSALKEKEEIKQRREKERQEELERRAKSKIDVKVSTTSDVGKSEDVVEKTDRTRKMYRGMDYKDGNILCGRCLEVKPKTKGLICYTCAKIIVNHNGRGIDTNKWNVKDYFCNTKITDGGRVFEIGIKVDEKTQKYLTMIGYGFIFKEEDPV